MSEGTLDMVRRLRVPDSGSSSIGIVADDWNSGGRCMGARIRGVNVGFLDEQVLVLVFRALDWDPQTLSSVARASRRLRAVAERVLWRDLCVSRAPLMVAALTTKGRVGGGWPALAKLLLFCCGTAAGAVVPVPVPVLGHFAPVSRFSKTSGRSFLPRRCGKDVLYVSDPCEHAAPGDDGEDDVGAYRGVFRGFVGSRTRARLVDGRTPLEPRVRCPYCGASVWSVAAPRGARRRLGAHERRLQYFVCVSGHLHGSCRLARLTSSDGGAVGSGSDDDDDDGFTDADSGRLRTTGRMAL
ncbi:EID1-like F-box protein 3 [Lolium rigidum]|uniref:EID1-like F-box protein 3 n=1 Tax=Lolium rigidum TaxID=89674 RepID=UPI001F5D2EC8|nr:EID1-like F-box protein 3 [Lolium rigidum]